MLIYLIIILVVTSLTYVSGIKGMRLSEKVAVGGLSLCILVLFAGLRDSEVGTDTRAYASGYEKNPPCLMDLVGDGVREPGFLALGVLAQLVSSSYWAMLTVIAAAVVACFASSIYQNSLNPAVSVFVFISMGYYTFFFNGARQGIACAIFSLSFKALRDGDFGRYALWVLLASLVHNSAIILLPFFFVFRRQFSWIYTAFIIILGGMAVVYFEKVLNIGVMISDKYTIYQEMEATGGVLLALFNVGLTIVFLTFRRFVRPRYRENYDILTYMFLCGTIIFLVVVLSDGYVELTRLSLYFHISAILIWPIIFASIRGRIVRYGLMFPVAAGHLLYYYVLLLNIGGLTPYSINTNFLS